jgi:1-acyl-sn-glycerol-3-phosphate acyltransferase
MLRQFVTAAARRPAFAGGGRLCVPLRQQVTSAAKRAPPPRRKLGTYVWRAVWMPYAALLTIPVATATASAYHGARGDTRAMRGFALYAWTGLLSLPLSAAFLLVTPYVLATDPDHRLLLNQIMLVWARLTTAPFYQPELRGIEHLPARDRPAVFVSNHQSWLDIYSLCWLDATLKFVAKSQIFWIPVAGWVMSLLGCIPLHRSTQGSGQLVRERCTDMVRAGVPVCFFAEGTRSKDGSLGE